MKILLVNDDGVDSDALNRLAEELNKKYDITVVAPAGECSAFSHCLSINKKLDIVKFDRTYKCFSLSGTPVDCVKFGIAKTQPDLLISGINKGKNMGSDVWYSGTVQAAFEGALNRIPSIAVSTGRSTEDGIAAAVEFISENIADLYTAAKICDVININVPDLPLTEIRGTKIVPISKTHYDDNHHITEESYTHISTKFSVRTDSPDENDVKAVSAGFIAISPLHIDCTDYSALYKLRKLL